MKQALVLILILVIFYSLKIYKEDKEVEQWVNKFLINAPPIDLS